MGSSKGDEGSRFGCDASSFGGVRAALAVTSAEAMVPSAEAGEVMPQKSTFFYPKVPTGLLLHTLDPARFVPIVL